MKVDIERMNALIIMSINEITLPANIVSTWGVINRVQVQAFPESNNELTACLLKRK